MTRRDLLISLLLGLGLAVVLVAGALLLPRGTGEPSAPISEPAPVQQEDRALLGVWAASVGNLDFPSRPDLTADELKNELDDLIDRTAQWGMNAVFLQVRPCADALYASGIFPVSSYLSSSRELPDGFDPLTYAVERAHAKGIEVHAWVNPLRVSTKDALEDLPESSPARQHPDWVVSYADGCLYWNPGVEGVRALVADGVGEILENYAVDGIHFDDYFYPYPQGDAAFADEEAFAASGGEKSLAEWRRENVTALIRAVSERIRSPSGRLLAWRPLRCGKTPPPIRREARRRRGSKPIRISTPIPAPGCRRGFWTISARRSTGRAASRGWSLKRFTTGGKKRWIKRGSSFWPGTPFIRRGGRNTAGTTRRRSPRRCA